MTIVLGYDGSHSSRAALAEAADLAADRGDQVVVVFAYYISPLGGGDVHDFKERLDARASEETSHAVSVLETKGVQTEVRHVSGKPADAILEVAEETGARLIVVGGTSHSPVAGALLGSVVLNLVQRSPVPLLVVPD